MNIGLTNLTTNKTELESDPLINPQDNSTIQNDYTNGNDTQ